MKEKKRYSSLFWSVWDNQLRIFTKDRLSNYNSEENDNCISLFSSFLFSLHFLAPTRFSVCKENTQLILGIKQKQKTKESFLNKRFYSETQHE